MNPLLSIPNYFIDRIVKTTATTVAEFAVNKINENRYAELFANSNMERRPLLCVSFNQDASSLAVGHEEGYTLYSLRSIDNLEKVHDGKVPQKTSVIERLFSSSLITLVSLNATRKLQVYHFQKENEICSHNYTGAILSVRLNRKRVVVCLEESIHVHNIRDMRLLHTIRDTPANPKGLFDLSAGDEACYLAYPGSATTGHVHVFDADALSAVCTIAAHEGPLAALKFNSDGSKLATASQKGTVIRVFEVPSGQRIAEFSRGMKRCVTIYSLAFNADSKFLCSSSDTETVHVFSLSRGEEQQQQPKPEEQDQSLSSWVSYFGQQASAYLPTQMNDLMLREKSFAYARLPMVGTKTAVAMPRIGNQNYLVVATSDGYLFCYTIEPEGGECTLMRQYRIGPLTQEEIQQQQQNSAGQVIIAGSAGNVVNEAQKLYPNLTQEQHEAAAPSTIKTPPLMVPIAAGSARQISTSPPSLTSAALSSSPGGPIQPLIPRKMATPVKATATVKAASPASNQNRASPRHDSESGGSSEDLAPLGDLNDLDEFPPLNHATS